MTMPVMPGPGDSIQRLNTVYRVFTDQHGRKWEAQADKGNNRPKEELRPIGFIPPWQPPMRFIWWDAEQQLTFRWAYKQLEDELSAHTARWYSDARKMALKEKLEVPEVGGVVDPLIRDVFGYPGLSPEIPMACRLGDPWMLYGDDYADRNEYLFSLLNQGMVMHSTEALQTIESRLRERMGLPEGEQHPDVPAAVLAHARAAEQPSPIKRSITAVGPQYAEPAPFAKPGKMPTYAEFFAECRANKMPVGEIAAAWQAHKAAVKAEAA